MLLLAELNGDGSSLRWDGQTLASAEKNGTGTNVAGTGAIFARMGAVSRTYLGQKQTKPPRAD